MWKYMQQFDGLLLLAGDLNAEPHTPAIQLVVLALCVSLINLHVWPRQDENRDTQSDIFVFATSTVKC